MSTKRQRLAQQTQGGEPTLSLLDFRAAAARTEVDAAAASHAGACATLEECYLAYCYLCRTGLWSEISPRLSPCGAFYLACEPSTIVSKRRRTEAPAGGAAVDAPVEAAAAAAAQVAPAAIADATAPEDLQATAADDEDDDDVLSSSGGEDEEEEQNTAAGALGPQRVPAAPLALEADRDAAEAAVLPMSDEQAQTFRVRTLTVPVSIANTALSAERLQQLLRLSDVEAGASISLAFVDSDSTVIVTHLQPGLVPPDVLEGDANDGEEDDDDVALPATVLPDDDELDAGGAVSCGSLRSTLLAGGAAP